MSEHRAGEFDEPIPFRNERYFCSNGEWFFQIRNGGKRGPFNNKDEMKAELLLFIKSKALARQALAG